MAKVKGPLPVQDQMGKPEYPYLDENGGEINDPVPSEPPVGYQVAPSMFEQVQAMVRSERLRQEAEEAGFESFEEADDFEIGDDYDPETPYENDFDPPIGELVQAGQAEIARKEAENSPPVTASGDKEPGRQAPQPKKPTSSEDENTGSKA